MKNRSIILITGPKHSGKTMCSRALEKMTGTEAFDLDEILERQTGKTPRVLFNEGAEVFRKAETEALALALSSVNPQIIAAGGGLIDNPEALALVKGCDHIVTVYLDVSAETAWQRIIAEGRELPPFLKTENPKETHHHLHKRRAESYKAWANITIDAENKTPEEIAQQITLCVAGLAPV